MFGIYYLINYASLVTHAGVDPEIEVGEGGTYIQLGGVAHPACSCLCVYSIQHSRSVWGHAPLGVINFEI